jgi:SAM-dependent methyltransferase
VSSGDGSDAWTLDLLRRCARNEISPRIALLRLLIAHGDVSALRLALAASVRAVHTSSIRDVIEGIEGLLAADAHGSALVLSMLQEERAAAGADQADEVERCRRLFDRLVRESPEASVALYSFGVPANLEAATAEVVEMLDRLGVIHPQRRLLEIGCGIGRFQQALARRVAAITGIDIAAAMTEEAERRCAGLPNVTLRVTSGRDLAPFPAESFDVVLAIDTLPYVFRAGAALVATHFAESARVLRQGGDLVILNLSYRGDLERDRQDVGDMAAASCLRVLRNGTNDLRLWDAATFHLRKSA